MHLRHANDTVVARKFSVAVGEQETGVVREDITVLAEECEGIAVGIVQAEQRAHLPVCRYGKVDQVFVGQLTLLAVLEAGDVLMRRCKIED